MLAHTHRLLNPHAGHVPSAVLREIVLLQEQFEDQHVRLAVCGEVKAGKSTLLNAIAGAALSPMAFDPLTNVPVRVTHGPRTTWRVGTQHLIDLAALEAQMRRHTGNGAEVVVETSLDLLQLGGQVELLDTPGMGSDLRMDEISSEALRSLDAIILVVRYPALFTEYTRQLTRALRQDIGKLFVVWNLDGSCSSLSEEERQTHAETLRRNVAGAHDLFLVDARRALEAASDAEDSGLAKLRTAVRDFLNSTSRQLVALREAGKRAQQLLTTAKESLATRQTMVAEVIGLARRQLDEIASKASAETEGAQRKLAETEAGLASLIERSKNLAAEAAARLHKALRRASRRWAWNGNVGELDNSVNVALEEYANAVASSANAAAHEMESAANSLGSTCRLEPRPLTIPYVVELTPAGRGTLGALGNWQLVRRTLWRSWYLEGLKQLERQAVAEDLAQHAQWLEATREAAVTAARAAVAQQAEAIRARADADATQVIEETDLEAYESEAQQLAQDTPILDDHMTVISQLATRARADL